MSKITQREEHLPFVVGIMESQVCDWDCYTGVSLLTYIAGSDLMLMDTVLACLKSAGRPTSVRTGSDMFMQPKLKGPL